MAVIGANALSRPLAMNRGSDNTKYTETSRHGMSRSDHKAAGEAWSHVAIRQPYHYSRRSVTSQGCACPPLSPSSLRRIHLLPVFWNVEALRYFARGFAGPFARSNQSPFTIRFRAHEPEGVTSDRGTSARPPKSQS